MGFVCLCKCVMFWVQLFLRAKGHLGRDSSGSWGQRFRERKGSESQLLWMKSKAWGWKVWGLMAKMGQTTALNSVKCGALQLVIFCLLPWHCSRLWAHKNIKSSYVLLIQPSALLPQTHPQSHETLPFFRGQDGCLTRQLQVMACEMTGLLLVRRLTGGPGSLFMELLWSFSCPINIWGKLAC